MDKEEQKAISFRLNLSDMQDRMLYDKLQNGKGQSASLSSYVKGALIHYFSIVEEQQDSNKMYDDILDMLHKGIEQTQDTVKSEMEAQVLKIIGAILSGVGISGGKVCNTNFALSDNCEITQESQLPDESKEFPDDLGDLLDQYQ